MEEFFGIFILTLLLLLVVIMVLYNIFLTVRAIFKFFFGDFFNKYLLIKNIDPAYKKVLERHFKYYQNLNEGDKKIFEKRVQKFINNKQFIAREMPKVTDTMKALVAGTAIQLTFGHPSIYFAHFDKIILYPDNYYSNIMKQYHQGEVNVQGLIILSWKNFVRGFSDESDGRNLGLHEMAHALRFENAFTNEEYDFLDEDLLKRWTNLCYLEIDKMLNGESDFFRDYAATNSQEFFAVAVENFFERPVEFKGRLPELYSVLARLLNQDPLLLLKKAS